MANRVVQASLVFVSRGTADVYEFRAERSGWALCTVNDRTGELQITSDWLNCAHRWPVGHQGAGVTMTAFLPTCDYDYLARKLLGTECREFSSALTTASIRERIIERRRDAARMYGANDEPPTTASRLRAFTRDVAREIWDEVGELASELGSGPQAGAVYFDRLSRQIHEHLPDIWEHAAEENTADYDALCSIILPALKVALRAENERRAASALFAPPAIAPGAPAWACIVCGVRHPLDHEGMLLAGGAFMACCSCEKTVRERALGALPVPAITRDRRALQAVGDLFDVPRADSDKDWPAYADRVVAVANDVVTGDEWPSLDEMVEALPAYVHEDGDPVNAIERIAAAGDELRRLQRRLADFPTREKLHALADDLAAIANTPDPSVDALRHVPAQLGGIAHGLRAMAAAETKADEWLRCTITIACLRTDGMPARERMRAIEARMMETYRIEGDDPDTYIVVETLEQDATR